VLALRAIELRDQQIYESPLNIFWAAMVALPVARRRKVRAMSDVPWFEPLINTTLKARQSRLGEETPVTKHLKDVRDTQKKYFETIISLLQEGIAALHALAKHHDLDIAARLEQSLREVGDGRPGSK
jgi:hypothetical protein